MLTLTWKETATPLGLVACLLVTLLIQQGVRAIGLVRDHLPGSCQFYLIGILFGFLFNFVLQWNIFLHPALFFLYFLPPVALEAGYSMPKRAFFDYLGPILLYAVIGTMMNTVITASLLYGFSAFYKMEIDLLSILLFATLISPTDPVSVLSIFKKLRVNEQLFILVSGESLFNDAFGIVLYNSLSAMAARGSVIPSDVGMALFSFATVAIGAVLLGVIFAVVTSIWTRISSSSPSIPSVVLAVPYICYLLAENIHLSGMLAIVSCGLWMARYVQKNLEEKPLAKVSTFLKTWAAIADTATFFFLGLSTISIYHNWDWTFVSVTIGAILLSRFTTIFVLTFLVNKLKADQIGWRHQLVLAYSGIRGPICYGLVQSLGDNVKGKDIMVTTAVVVIFVTDILQGLVIKPFLNGLKIEREVEEEASVSDRRTDLTVGIEAIAGFRDIDSWQQKCLTFNEKYIEPLLTRRPPRSSPPKMSIVMPVQVADSSPLRHYPIE